jgi:hypothetical protein
MPGNRRYIHPELKKLVLKMQRENPTMTRSEIKELTGVSVITQSRIRTLERETGEVIRTPLQMGRPRLLNALDAAVSVHLS